MDGSHGPDLLDLRLQGNAPVGLLVCRNPHVTKPFCFHSLKPFQHAKYRRRKLSGYPHRPRGESAECPAENDVEAAASTQRYSNAKNGLPKTLPQKKDRG